MRKTEAACLMPRTLTRVARLSTIALGVGLLFTSNAARAGDDDDEPTFEEKMIGGIMKGLGGINMDNSGIDYRERSPLVVPPKLDLPPPASASAEVKAPNWPKDPDEARRKAYLAAKKKEARKDAGQAYYDASRPLSPKELDVAKRRRAAAAATPIRTARNPVAGLAPC